MTMAGFRSLFCVGNLFYDISMTGKLMFKLNQATANNIRPRLMRKKQKENKPAQNSPNTWFDRLQIPECFSLLAHGFLQSNCKNNTC